MPLPGCDRGRTPVSVLAFTLALPACLHAQPWVLPRSEGSVSLAYQNTHVRDHFYSRGLRLDVGHVRTQSVSIDVDYGLTGRVSVGAGLPLVASKYLGEFPHRHADGRTLDDGRFHGGFQDLRFDVRVLALERPVAITPFLAFSAPTRDYEFFAHSAIGLAVREAQAGAYVGAAFSRFYVQGRYSYAVPERVLGRRRTRSNVDAEVGWVAAPRIRVFAFQMIHASHDGVEILPRFVGLSADEIHHHDQLGRSRMLDIGGGIAVAITPSMDGMCSASKTLSGANTHAVQYALTVGASWRFGRRSAAGHHADDRDLP